MLPPAELEHLAVAFQCERDRRLSSPRAADARTTLARTARALRDAAAAAAELGRHECAVAGVTLTEVAEMHEKMEDFAAKLGAGVININELNANGRRKLVDYVEPSAKFMLVRQIADRLDEIGVPLGGQDTGSRSNSPNWSRPGLLHRWSRLCRP
jgi:hypothetical protein